MDFESVTMRCIMGFANRQNGKYPLLATFAFSFLLGTALSSCDPVGIATLAVYERISPVDGNGSALVVPGPSYVQGITPFEEGEISLAYVPEPEFEYPGGFSKYISDFPKNTDLAKLRYRSISKTDRKGCFRANLGIPPSTRGLIVLRILRKGSSLPIYQVVYHEELEPHIVVLLPAKKEDGKTTSNSSKDILRLIEECP